MNHRFAYVANETESLLTAGEVAELFKVSTVTVGVWADQGKLPFFRTPGGHRRFKRSDVDAFIEGEPDGPRVATA